MLEVTYRMLVDVADKSRVNHVVIKQGDSNSRRLLITMLSNGKPFDMSDVAIVTVKGAKPDGKIIYSDAQIDEKSRVSYLLPESAAQIPGKTTLEITLNGSGGELVTSFDLFLIVENQLFDENDFVSEDDLSGFREYLLRALKAAERAENVENTFQEGLGTVNDLLADLEEEKLSYKAFLDDLKEKLENGDFQGERGPQGEDGKDAVVQNTDYILGFQIEDTDLICYFRGEMDGLPYIDGSGCLIMEA